MTPPTPQTLFGLKRKYIDSVPTIVFASDDTVVPEVLLEIIPWLGTNGVDSLNPATNHNCFVFQGQNVTNIDCDGLGTGSNKNVKK